MHQERKNRILSTNFRLDDLSDKDCVERFRFKGQQILILVSTFPFLGSSTLSSRRRYKTDTVESFCIVLRRRSTSTRWSDVK